MPSDNNVGIDRGLLVIVLLVTIVVELVIACWHLKDIISLLEKLI